MRTFLPAFLMVISATIGFAQRPAADTTKTFASAADVQALIAKANAERKDGQTLVVERLLQLAPYNANLEYRPGAAPPTVHETEAELFYVIEGTGTMVTGGKLTEEMRTNATNLRGTAITGGERRSIARGDFIIVPENTAHWISQTDGKLVVLTIHLPRPVPVK